jgi:hypothetical protein
MEMATLFQLLQQYRNDWQQQQKPAEEDPNTPDSGAPPVPEDYSNLPNRTPIETKFFRSQDGVTKDETKRGSCKYSKTYVTDLGLQLKITHSLTCNNNNNNTLTTTTTTTTTNNNNNNNNNNFCMHGTRAICNLILEYDTI